MSVVLILLLLFSVPLADAYLGAIISLATVLRVGAIYIAQLWRSPQVRSTVASVLAHVFAGTLAYLAYDRGADKPSQERYVIVSLAGVKSKLAGYKDSGFYPPDTYGNCGYNEIKIETGCAVYSRAVSYNSSSCSLSYGSWTYMGINCGATLEGYNTSACLACYSHVNSASSCTSDGRAQKTLEDPVKGNEVLTALGTDIQAGGSFSSTVPSGASVVNMGGDVYETNNYGDANGFISAGSTGSGGSLDTGEGITKQEVQDAVSGALTEKLGTNPGGITSPSYDNSYENPTENNISSRITSFISSNPIISAINGSHLSLSGATCTATVGSTFDKPLTLDFCWMASYLTMFGNVMVIFAGLAAAFIIFRRGD